MDPTTQDFFAKMLEMTGKSYDDIHTLYTECGLTKHSDIRSYFMDHLNLSYGYANTLVHLIAKPDGASLAQGKDLEAILEEIYSEKKGHFRPLHNLLMAELESFGDFEILPKKGYLSLKRKSQFAMIGPKTATRMEIGINIKGLEGTDRLLEQPKGSMCKFIVKLSSIEEVDSELINWLKMAYDQSK